MTDERTENLEARLTAAFGRHALPPAPVGLYRHLEQVVDVGQALVARSGRRRLVAVAALVVLLALAWIAFIGIVLIGSVPGAPDAETSPRATAITSVDGLPVRGVGAVLALRRAGGLRDQPVVVGGYWTNRSRPHSCVPPTGQPGLLEHYCSDGEYGITERNEPILRYVEPARAVPATGPSLTPQFDLDAAKGDFLFMSQFGFELPPLPIVVRGHFDDPRASDCRPEARQLCLDRLVVDRVVLFDIESAWAATPPLVQATFPDGEARPAPFGPDECPQVTDPGFVGWTVPAAIGLPDEEGLVWVMVSRDDEVVYGDWTDDPAGSGRRLRMLAKQMCAARASDELVTRGPMPTSMYLEWSDGTFTRIGAHASRP
jgi:hypothetical protein